MQQGAWYHPEAVRQNLPANFLLFFLKITPTTPSPPPSALTHNNQQPVSMQVKNDKVTHITGAKLDLNHQYAPYINL